MMMIANCVIVSVQEIFICYLGECDRDRSRHSRQKILRYLLILKHKCLFVTKMSYSYFSIVLINYCCYVLLLFHRVK